VPAWQVVEFTQVKLREAPDCFDQFQIFEWKASYDSCFQSFSKKLAWWVVINHLKNLSGDMFDDWLQPETEDVWSLIA